MKLNNLEVTVNGYYFGVYQVGEIFSQLLLDLAEAGILDISLKSVNVDNTPETLCACYKYAGDNSECALHAPLRHTGENTQ